MEHARRRLIAGLGIALCCVLVPACAPVPPAPEPPRPPGAIDHVILVTIDGLHADAVRTLGPQRAAGFFRLRAEGAYTDNARTDPALAATLPDHLSALTGRRVLGDDGHGLVIDTDPGPPATVHLSKGAYVASAFDVVHDHGFGTALYVSKDKFALLDRSWNPLSGAPDRVGADNGRDKIDTYFYSADMGELVRAFIDDMRRRRYAFVLLQLREPDSTGHRSNWDLAIGSAYMNAVVEVDRLVGQLLDFVRSDPALNANTAVVVTADHSGELGKDFHLLLPDAGLVDSGIIPFYVWGPGVTPRADLYALNRASRLDPERTIPPISAAVPPIRNGDAANLALALLRLPPVPQSTINARQDLATGP